MKIKDIINSENKKEKTIEFVNKCKKNIVSKGLSKKEMQRNKTIVKIYIRYIAVYISKMTDNFASEKYKKIVSTKYFLKND